MKRSRGRILQGTFGPGSTSGASPILIGDAREQSVYKFRGYLDEVAIYDTALSLAQVQAHYAATAETPVPEPAALALGVAGALARLARGRGGRRR